jgi:hypothetical protein
MGALIVTVGTEVEHSTFRRRGVAPVYLMLMAFAIEALAKGLIVVRRAEAPPRRHLTSS